MIFEIVYQHSDFVLINKPCGISVHKDDQEVSLTRLVAKQLQTEQVWLIHRLDKVTSGLLMLALNQRAASELSQLFAEHRIQKTYLALSLYKPKKKQGLILGDMEKSRRGAWKLCTSKENPALTRFYSVHCEPNLRLFILKPKTGKTHQLRVAMKSLGSPILGDELYGGNSAKFDRTYLHAYCLEFEYQREKFIIQCLPRHGEFFQKPSVIDKFTQL